jgi:molybdate transport system substrate-binding protein
VTTRWPCIAGALLLALWLADAARADDAAKRPILVFAAASLTESFSALGREFEAADRGAAVKLNFAGSSALVAQIQSGAPADVIATADTANMAKLEQADRLAAPPATFARNTLEIVVERGNPKNVRVLSDLARPDLVLILAADTVPAGRYAQEILKRAGVTVTPSSYEENVKAVLNKVALGEADAGIVYATDIRAAGERVRSVVIPEAQNAVAHYPIAVVKRSDSNPDARAFRDFVLSPEGRAVLMRYGFLSP